MANPLDLRGPEFLVFYAFASLIVLLLLYVARASFEGGRAPRTSLFPYEWYESPNIHFLTVDDFENLTALEDLVVERRYFLAGRRKVTALPNLLAEVAVFLVRRSG